MPCPNLQTWDPEACRTVTVKATDDQWIRWRTVAGIEPDLGAFLARAADFYAARLQARLEMARRMEREGRL